MKVSIFCTSSMLALVLFGFRKVLFPSHFRKYFIKIGKIRAKIHECGKIKSTFRLGMTPIYDPKNGQIKSLVGCGFFWSY